LQGPRVTRPRPRQQRALRSDLGDLVGKPVNSLLDEVLTPVDRDVFKRQNRYYDALKPDAAKDAAGAAAGADVKH
jgi:hypothetical protein